MIFGNKERSIKFASNPGKRFKEQFHGRVEEDGSITLVSDGFIDTQEVLRKDSVGASVPEIIDRALKGDVSVFRNDEGFYGDVVGMPKTYADILNTVNDARYKFEHLDVEIRNKFNNSFEQWFATYGTEEWLIKHGVEIKEKVVEEVKEDAE